MVNTRSANKEILQLDPEIERTLFRLREELRDTFRELPFALEPEEDKMLMRLER